jgi:hypothetical protein
MNVVVVYVNLVRKKMLEGNMHDQHLILVVFEYPLEISRL